MRIISEFYDCLVFGRPLLLAHCVEQSAASIYRSICGNKWLDTATNTNISISPHRIETLSQIKTIYLSISS